MTQAFGNSAAGVQGVTSQQPLPVGANNLTPAGQKIAKTTNLPTASRRILGLGDSTIQYNIGICGQVITSVTLSFGSSYGTLWADTETPSGAGTLTYDAGTKTLQWTPLNGVPGPRTDATKTGILTVQSGVPGQALYLVWYGASRTYTSGSSTVTIAANGFQAWSYANRGVLTSMMAASGQMYRYADLCPGCPLGTDGIFGMGGATASELRAAEWQWGQIESDVDYIQIGTNDFTNAAITAAAYVADIQYIIESRLAKGTSLVIWSTIYPRTGESATSRQRKAKAARLMRAYAATKNGQVYIHEAAFLVTDPATGTWVTNGSDGPGVHPSGLTGSVMGYDLAAILSGFGESYRSAPATYPNVYDATENPGGNIINTTAGMSQFIGSGGTSGTGAAGTVPTSWKLERTVGAAMTLTGAKVAKGNGKAGEYYQVVLASAAANELGRLVSTAGISVNMAAGKEYRMDVRVIINSCASMTQMAAGVIQAGVTARNPEAYQGQATDFLPDTTTPRALTLHIPFSWTAKTGVVGLFPYIQFGNGNGGAADIYLESISLYEVVASGV